jgi:hypothetical protein
MKKKYAFTMIEILMIALVMGTALLWVLAVMKKMEQSNTKIAENVIATNLAVQWYELLHAQENDVRYDSLLSIYWSDASNLLWLMSRVHWLEDWIYYVVYAEQKSWLVYSWDELLTWLDEENVGWDSYKQLRVILWAVCSGENTKLDSNGKCRSGSEEAEFIVYTGIAQWSWICLQDTWWLPCTWWWKFFREIIVTQDVNRCWFGTWTIWDTGQNIACEWTWENTIYRYRYGYNVCSRVFYNRQAWWQARKKQVAEICAKIN